MNKCLVTQLATSVSDNTLPKLGELVLYATDFSGIGEEFYLNAASGKSFNIDIINGYLTDSSGNNVGTHKTIKHTTDYPTQMRVSSGSIIKN